MIPINRKPGSSGGSSVGTLVGMGAGAAIGSIVPGVGTLAGAGLGATLGGVTGGLVAPPKAPEQNVETGGAMQRRLSAYQPPQNNLTPVREGILALKDVSPQVREEAAAPLFQAYMRGAKQQNPNLGVA